jgi:hypothetical protein
MTSLRIGIGKVERIVEPEPGDAESIFPSIARDSGCVPLKAALVQRFPLQLLPTAWHTQPVSFTREVHNIAAVSPIISTEVCEFSEICLDRVSVVHGVWNGINLLTYLGTA